jgi:hypothetical protein
MSIAKIITSLVETNPLPSTNNDHHSNMPLPPDVMTPKEQHHSSTTVKIPVIAGVEIIQADDQNANEIAAIKIQSVTTTERVVEFTKKLPGELSSILDKIDGVDDVAAAVEEFKRLDKQLSEVIQASEHINQQHLNEANAILAQYNLLKGTSDELTLKALEQKFTQLAGYPITYLTSTINATSGRIAGEVAATHLLKQTGDVLEQTYRHFKSAVLPAVIGETIQAAKLSGQPPANPVKISGLLDKFS